MAGTRPATANCAVRSPPTAGPSDLNAPRSTGRGAQPNPAQGAPPPETLDSPQTTPAAPPSASWRAHGSAIWPAALATLSSIAPLRAPASPLSTQPRPIEATEAPEPAPSWWGHRSLLFKSLLISIVLPTLFLFGFTTRQSLYRTEYTWTYPTTNGLTHLPSPFVMSLEVNTTAHRPLLATLEHAHLLTDLLTTQEAAQSSLSHLSSRVTHDLACTFRHHHHNRIHHPSSSISTSNFTSTTQHTLTTVWSIHNLTKHTLTHLTHLSTHSGYLPLEHLYQPLLRRATVKLEASHVSPEQREWMSMIPKMYFDYEKYDGVSGGSGGGGGGARARWSEYIRARATVAEVEAAVAALEREKAIVVAMEEMVARFADSLGGLAEFLLTSPHVVRGDVEDGSRGRGWSWSWSSRWWWGWSGEPEQVEEPGEEEDDAMREYLKWWFFDNVVIYTGTRWRVFEQDWHGLGCRDLF